MTEGKRRRVVSMLVIAAGVPLFGLIGMMAAGGAHIHTVGQYAHGVGDATDSDRYIHPYNHNIEGKAHGNAVGVHEWRADGTEASDDANSCDCRHNHIYWDTNPSVECRFGSFNAAFGNGSASLNGHNHQHHNFCR